MWHGYHDWMGMWSFPIIVMIIIVIGRYLILSHVFLRSEALSLSSFTLSQPAKRGII